MSDEAGDTTAADKSKAQGQQSSAGKSQTTAGGQADLDFTDPKTQSKYVPANRFHAVNEDLKAEKAKRETLEAQVKQYEAVLTDPRVAAALNAPAGKPSARPVDDVEDTYDPFDKEKMSKYFGKMVQDAIAQHVAPVRDAVTRQLWTQQEQQAISAFGKENFEKDRQAVLNKVRQLPGLSLVEAAILVKAERDGLDRAPAGYDGVGTANGGHRGRPTGADDADSPDSLSADEKQMAANFGISEDDYLKEKRIGEAQRRARLGMRVEA